MSIIDNLKWRYATKRMNGSVVSDADLATILEAINLTATSYGLQPFSVLVVTNSDIKTKLQAAAYGQPQLVESSHVLVFAIPEKLTAADVTTFIEHVAAVRSIPVEALDGYKQMIVGTVESLTAEQQQTWAAKQAYIALGTALTAAAELKVDACPMEGFSKEQFDEILGLKAKGLTSAVILPLGYRSEEDATSQYIKVRKPIDTLVHYVK
ncbi:nitroreductase family protein [Ferruginibacter yonginensis]|uniref:Nitroreductase family protein n=1 Tax=Ferruginibacter yonginensis TaxID=1310416 RepID=A0ABV8QXP1_9BACT